MEARTAWSSFHSDCPQDSSAIFPTEILSVSTLLPQRTVRSVSRSTRRISGRHRRGPFCNLLPSPFLSRRPLLWSVFQCLLWRRCVAPDDLHDATFHPTRV